MNTLTFHLQDESQTAQVAQLVSTQLLAPIWVELIGDLGVGKTTFTRYVLQALGHQGTVKSPTYTLVEPYQLYDCDFYHFDLYRLSVPEELEYLGIRDYVNHKAIGFVEWPSKGLGFLPKMDIGIYLSFLGEGRTMKLIAQTEKGQQIIRSLQSKD